MAKSPTTENQSQKKTTRRGPGRPRKNAQPEKEQAVEAAVDEKSTDEAPETSPMSDFDFTQILDVLIPPKSVEVTDAFGNQYKLVTSVSARQQVQLFRIVEDLQKTDAMSKVMSSGLVGGEGGVAQMLMYLGSDEEVMACLAEAFEIAHPAAFDSAMEAANTAGVPAEDAADCFAVEELVSAIVPLFLRLIKRTAQAASVMQGIQETIN